MFDLIKKFKKSSGFSEDEVLEYLKLIKATEKEVVRIKAKKVKEMDALDSKFFGNPYLPKGFEYPVNFQGEALKLLAQFNLKDLPKNSYLPTNGILQFYILPDDSYGLLYDESLLSDNAKSNFRVVYHRDLSIPQDESLLPDWSQKGFEMPSHDVFSLSFALGKVFISLDDFKLLEIVGEEFSKFLAENNKFFKDDGVVLDFGSGHKIGGYPSFPQLDVRGDGIGENMILLFQMESQPSGNWQISWGDAGVANFFIEPEALNSLDFSNALYSWECS